MCATELTAVSLTAGRVTPFGTSRTVSALSVSGPETATNRLEDDWQKFDSCG
jgi:hypothetical protein